ncbi:unnamed protein product [Ceratitis capitata]|uniref:(Mediterranean fruit fly) hypothetical protein n=1 Tax=Ceratitis capitata TaxID=7213 RepID=A0A811VB77_CERCA|nr:unnamed protein product [Ceratitis capitata]
MHECWKKLLTAVAQRPEAMPLQRKKKPLAAIVAAIAPSLQHLLYAGAFIIQIALAATPPPPFVNLHAGLSAHIRSASSHKDMSAAATLTAGREGGGEVFCSNFISIYNDCQQ